MIERQHLHRKRESETETSDSAQTGGRKPSGFFTHSVVLTVALVHRAEVCVCASLLHMHTLGGEVENI